MNTPKHILVIRLSAMGDVAMTIPVLQAFRKAYPEVQLTIVSKGFFKPIFKEIPNLEFVEAAVQDQHKGLGGLLRLARHLKTLDIDAVADLHNVIRSKVISKYLQLTNIKTAVIDKGRSDKKALTHAKGNPLIPIKSTHERYADVFRKLGFEIDLQNPIIQKRKPVPPKLQAIIEKSSKMWIGMAPFAAFESKMYPLELMEKAITRLTALKKYEILLFGGGKEEARWLESIAREHAGVHNLTGKLSFQEELAVISNLDGMVAMDSGNGHLAAMYGIPVITLWGVTHPAAGFVPFNQPMENQITVNREEFPLIPTSIYGNKFPLGYEKVLASIDPEVLVEKITSRF